MFVVIHVWVDLCESLPKPGYQTKFPQKTHSQIPILGSVYIILGGKRECVKKKLVGSAWKKEGEKGKSDNLKSEK